MFPAFFLPLFRHLSLRPNLSSSLFLSLFLFVSHSFPLCLYFPPSMSRLSPSLPLSLSPSLPHFLSFCIPPSLLLLPILETRRFLSFRAEQIAPGNLCSSVNNTPPIVSGHVYLITPYAALNDLTSAPADIICHRRN